MHRRARVRLGQDQRLTRPSHCPDVGGQPREAPGDDRAPVSEHAETRAVDSAENVFADLPNEVVLAVPEEDEVPAIDPLEECVDLLDLASIERRRSRHELSHDLVHPLAHHRPVLHRRPDIAENPADATDELLEALGLGLAIDFELHQRFGQRAGHPCARREDLREATVRLPEHVDDRMDRKLDPVSAAGELHANRVHQERHVIRDDLDDRVRRLPAVLCEPGVIRPHAGGAGGAVTSEVPDSHRRAVEVTGAALGQIPRWHPVVELPDERLALVYQLGRNVVAQTAADGLNERRFGLLHPQRHRCTPFDRAETAAAQRNLRRHGRLASLPDAKRLGHT